VIKDRSEELRVFHARHFTERVDEHQASTNGHRSELTDEEVKGLARGAKNAAKFDALWSGDVSGYPSHSEADQAFVCQLAFFTQDVEQLDRLYRQSGLCRQKWLDRPDYRRRTITRALSSLREIYTPDDGARMVVGSNGQASSLSLPYIGGDSDDDSENDGLHQDPEERTRGRPIL
jgi:primase-polymerase (primpol)-like protein